MTEATPALGPGSPATPRAPVGFFIGPLTRRRKPQQIQKSIQQLLKCIGVQRDDVIDISVHGDRGYACVGLRRKECEDYVIRAFREVASILNYFDLREIIDRPKYLRVQRVSGASGACSEETSIGISDVPSCHQERNKHDAAGPIWFVDYKSFKEKECAVIEVAVPDLPEAHAQAATLQHKVEGGHSLEVKERTDGSPLWGKGRLSPKTKDEPSSKTKPSPVVKDKASPNVNEKPSPKVKEKSSPKIKFPFSPKFKHILPSMIKFKSFSKAKGKLTPEQSNAANVQSDITETDAGESSTLKDKQENDELLEEEEDDFLRKINPERIIARGYGASLITLGADSNSELSDLSQSVKDNPPPFNQSTFYELFIANECISESNQDGHRGNLPLKEPSPTSSQRPLLDEDVISHENTYLSDQERSPCHASATCRYNAQGRDQPTCPNQLDDCCQYQNVPQLMSGLEFTFVQPTTQMNLSKYRAKFKHTHRSEQKAQNKSTGQSWITAPCNDTVQDEYRAPLTNAVQKEYRAPLTHTAQEEYTAPCSHTVQEEYGAPCTHIGNEENRTPFSRTVQVDYTVRNAIKAFPAEIEPTTKSGYLELSEYTSQTDNSAPSEQMEAPSEDTSQLEHLLPCEQTPTYLNQASNGIPYQITSSEENTTRLEHTAPTLQTPTNEDRTPSEPTLTHEYSASTEHTLTPENTAAGEQTAQQENRERSKDSNAAGQSHSNPLRVDAKTSTGHVACPSFCSQTAFYHLHEDISHQPHQVEFHGADVLLNPRVFRDLIGSRVCAMLNSGGGAFYVGVGEGGHVEGAPIDQRLEDIFRVDIDAMIKSIKPFVPTSAYRVNFFKVMGKDGRIIPDLKVLEAYVKPCQPPEELYTFKNVPHTTGVSGKGYRSKRN